MKKPVLIVENNLTSLVKENNTNSKDYILGGEFTRFDVKNRNERIYTAESFLPALNELNERMSTLGVVYGEFDHPDVFDTSLSRASHVIKSINYVKENNCVNGQIKLLNTYWGKEAKAIIDDGCPLFVSSRAAGVTEANGNVTLKKLFTYDIVADPGFATAKLSSVNESFGFSNNTNFRIYEMSDESKINDLFNMNKNDFVTKDQLTEYSKYLVKELASTKNEVKTAISKGTLEPKKLEELLTYQEELNKTNEQIVKYLDYLAEKIQVVVNENSSLKDTTDKLIKHNDYLAESLEKTINYSEYLAENLDKNITYSEYLAENLDKNIAYSEYLAENLDNNIAYSEYIAENLDKNISYSEYLAENLDKSIEYSEYLAEHVEGNIAYAEYLAENLDDNIAYSEYIAENLDKTVSYAGMIAEKLNGSKLNENFGEESFPTPLEAGIGEEEHEEEENVITTLQDLNNQENALLSELEKEEEEEENGEESHEEESHEELENQENKEECETCEHEEEAPLMEEPVEVPTSVTESELSKQIDTLIAEAKKRKVAETVDLNFLKFLNKTQVDSFYALTNEEQEQVKLHINERSYFSSADVLRLISEALSVTNETLEEKLVRLIPESLKASWESLNESGKKSVLSQARLYPDLNTEQKIEHFWLTRNLRKNESTKKLIANESVIANDELTEKEAQAILEKFRKL